MDYINREFIEECISIIKESGEIIKNNWLKPHNIHHKGSVDLVTETDFAVEKFLKEKLKNLLPNASFLAEESSSDSDKPEKLCWIIDPVDGTTNFVHRIPQVGTSVALWDGEKIVFGMVNAPILDEYYWAYLGGGAFMKDTKIHVSSINELTDSLVCTGFPYEMMGKKEQIIKWLDSVLPKTQGLRRLGAASIDLCYVASGKFEAFYEGGLKPWDVGAGWLIVEEAGGKVTNLLGSRYMFGDILLASNGYVHEAMLTLLN